MFSRHHTILRLSLALAGMVILCVAFFVVLGLGIRGNISLPATVIRLLGWERRERLHWWYAHAMAGLLPGDKDKDGCSDGLEWFLGKDPNNPANYPEMVAGPSPGSPYYLFCGDHIHMRWCLTNSKYYDGEFFAFPRGYRARWRIGSRPGEMALRIRAVRSADELIFSANSDGEWECDVEAGDKAESVTLWVKDEHDKAREWAIGWQVLGWRGKSEPVVFCDDRAVVVSPPPDPVRHKSYEKAFVAWPSSGLQGPYALEHRRKHSGAGWEVVRYRHPQDVGYSYRSIVPFAFFDGHWLDRDCGFEDYEWRMTEILTVPP